MSTETLPQGLKADVVAQFGAGTKFLILTASAAVNVLAVQLGSSNKRIVLNGCQEGFTYDGSNDGGFDLLQVMSAVDQPGFVIVVGDDDVSYPNAVNITGGTVNSQEVPASTVADQVAVESMNGQKALFPVNLARRRITVFSDPTNAANTVIYLRAPGKANDLACIVPGQSLQFEGTYGLDCSAGAANDWLYLFEEF